MSRELASKHGCGPAKAEATALMHDVARALDDKELRDLARRFGLRLSELEEGLPILIHGEIGTEILRRDYGVADWEILNAIAYHTTGRRDMGTLDMVLFLADKLDPEKINLSPELAEVRHLADRDLAAAVLRFFDLQVSSLIRRKQQIHPRMVEARNDLLTRLR